MRSKKRIEEVVEHFDSWRDHLPPERWALYEHVISEANRRDVAFAVGGGLAAMAYAGQLRDIKDLDLYIRREDRDPMIEILRDSGWTDYYDTLPYDRHWIFRSCRDDSILDVMWAMANQRAQVDDEWLNGPLARVGDVTFRLLRPEETLWSKLYVMQRDRCDWPDAMNMLYSIGPELDWKHLLGRTRDDTPLLGALVAAFRGFLHRRACSFRPGYGSSSD